MRQELQKLHAISPTEVLQANMYEGLTSTPPNTWHPANSSQLSSQTCPAMAGHGESFGHPRSFDTTDKLLYLCCKEYPCIAEIETHPVLAEVLQWDVGGRGGCLRDRARGIINELKRGKCN